MTDCLFCRMVAGAIPVRKIHEDDLCIAIRDIAPQAPAHALVIPKKHLSGVNALGPEDDVLAGHLLRVGADVARADGIAESGYRLVLNTNRDAGQTVFHLHLHVLGGRPLSWPPG